MARASTSLSTNEGSGATYPATLPIADPERALAVTYAPVDRRAALAALFALDERLGAVVGGTTETGIGLIRLAWWREALVALDGGTVPPEPTLAAVARDILPLGITGTEVSAIEDGWSLLLGDEPDDATIALYGAGRGGRLFVASGAVLGGADARLERAGAGWALADLAHRHSSAMVRERARAAARRALADIGGRWPMRLRPLGALAVLARRDAATDAPRRQGAPARIARMLALRLTGR